MYVIVLIWSNKHSFACYYDVLFLYATALSVNYDIFYTPYNFLKAIKSSQNKSSNSGINKWIILFARSDNKATIFCNNFIIKYFSDFILNSKHFVTVVI